MARPSASRPRGRSAIVLSILADGVTVAEAARRWRIINTCTSRFLKLRLDGHQMDLLATDIGRLAEPRRVDEVEVLNSGRVDVLVTVGEGTSEL